MNFIKQNQIVENPEYTKSEIEEIIIMTRLDLYNRGLCCGAKAIKGNWTNIITLTHCHLKEPLAGYCQNIA